MSSQNEEKAKRQQKVLDDVKTEAFYQVSEYCSYEKSFELSDILLYGFRYNAGQNPALQDEFEDCRPIVELLKTAKNNDEITRKTEFPDWKCDNGLIEHFEVSATKDTKKGQKLKQVRSEMDDKLRDRIKQDNDNDKLQDMYSELCPMPEQSIDNFILSFKKHWDNHVEKLKKYEGNKDCVCFLIESDCFGLKQKLKSDCQYELGIRTGHIVENYTNNRDESFDCILLGRCKNLLEYIYEYKDIVHYVIFVSTRYIEIIKTDKSQYIAGLLKDYEYHPTIGIIESIAQI